MPRVRSKSLEKYNISSHKFMELYHFCLQYNEWRDALKYKCDTIKSIGISDMPTTHNYSDITQKMAIERAELSKKCELIEQTAIETDADLYPYILKAVTNEGISYNYLKMVCSIPCGRNTYYEKRRKFYWLLSQKK